MNYKFINPLRKELEFGKKKMDLTRSLWFPIRSKTIDVLLENKDEIRTLLHKERIARIATSVTGNCCDFHLLNTSH